MNLQWQTIILVLTIYRIHDFDELLSNERIIVSNVSWGAPTNLAPRDGVVSLEMSVSEQYDDETQTAI